MVKSINTWVSHFPSHIYIKKKVNVLLKNSSRSSQELRKKVRVNITKGHPLKTNQGFSKQGKLKTFQQLLCYVMFQWMENKRNAK